MLDIFMKELAIAIIAAFVGYLVYKFDLYNAVVLYLLIRIWFELEINKNDR